MPDPAFIQTLEMRLVNAWPALETQIVDGWIVRFAQGLFEARELGLAPRRGRVAR